MALRFFTTGLATLNAAVPQVVLSASTIVSSATIGTTIGTLSVSNGVGTYSFLLTNNAGGLFSLSGAVLQVASALTAGSYAISVSTSNGSGSVGTQTFLITVTSAGGVDITYFIPAI